MAKRRKKPSSKGCPEPLNTMIDLAGAAAMGAFTKHKIKRDYAKGQSQDSIEAAMMVYGMGAFRRGSAGLMSLGGLYGVNSAIKDIERSEQARRLRTPSMTMELISAFIRQMTIGMLGVSTAKMEAISVSIQRTTKHAMNITRH